MALLTPPQPLVEPSNKACKSKDYPKKARGLCLCAFIFSIFIYILIFYIFDLSLKNLLRNTEFWFLISNTLIFIIATHYRVFSSLNEKQDIFDEYTIYTTQARNHACSFVSRYHEMVERSFPKEDIKISKEMKKVEIAPKNEPPERIPEIIKNEPKKLNDDVLEIKPRDVANLDNEDAMKIKIKEARQFSRFKSEKYSTNGAISNNKSSVMRRSKTEKHEPREDDNEFPTMSNEEINRRVEEFIQKFNRQIRLQRENNFN